jgi:hypothetical protein
VAAFRDRSLAGTGFPYVLFDACFGKARVGGDRRGRGSRVAAQAVVIATGISADGLREILGFDVGDSESGAFWTRFLRSLKARDLSGVQLATSDAHTGLTTANSRDNPCTPASATSRRPKPTTPCSSHHGRTPPPENIDTTSGYCKIRVNQPGRSLVDARLPGQLIAIGYHPGR